METASRPSSERARAVVPASSSVREVAFAPSVKSTLLAISAFGCGITFPFKLDMVGEIYLIEPLILLFALQRFLSNGPGRGFVASVFYGFLAAGLLTFCGYLLADLFAANESWQYLKGWGRVTLLVLDSVAMMVLAAHGRRNIFFIALGISIGGLLWLLSEGTPLTHWKIGYGDYLVILLMAAVGLSPPWIAGVLIGSFGAISVALDYRSLGAECLVVAAVVLWRCVHERNAVIRNLFLLGLITLTLVAILSSMIYSTQEDYAERREQSNIGRYVGIIVAWRAIVDSPVIGFGSWAADVKYARMLRDEAHRLNQNRNNPMNLGESLLPHCQFLQAWIEGGILGISFFILLGMRLVGALKWFALQRPLDGITPLALFFLILAVWNLAASPFLGSARIYIALAVALIVVAAHESRVRAAQNGSIRVSSSVSVAPVPQSTH